MLQGAIHSITQQFAVALAPPHPSPALFSSIACPCNTSSSLRAILDACKHSFGPMTEIVDPTIPVVKNLLLLDSEGKRIAVKYFTPDM